MRKTNAIEDDELFDEILNSAKPEDKLLVSKSLHIANQIITILEKKDMLQKDFAMLMKKKDSEISRWLSGFHNFTLETICKIEIALGETIIITPK